MGTPGAGDVGLQEAVAGARAARAEAREARKFGFGGSRGVSVAVAGRRRGRRPESVVGVAGCPRAEERDRDRERRRPCPGSSDRPLERRVARPRCWSSPTRPRRPAGRRSPSRRGRRCRAVRRRSARRRRGRRTCKSQPGCSRAPRPSRRIAEVAGSSAIVLRTHVIESGTEPVCVDRAVEGRAGRRVVTTRAREACDASSPRSRSRPRRCPASR